MSIDVELAERFDLVAEKFQSEWQPRLPRIDVDNAAATGELSPRGYLRDALITAIRELVEKVFHVYVCSASDLGNGRLERAALWRRLTKTCACRYDNARTSVALDLRKQCQPFSGDFRIGQNIFYCGQLSFWKEQRVWLPVEQTFVKQFLRMNARTEDPNRGIDILSIIG